MDIGSKYKFYLSLCSELIQSPWLYFHNLVKWHFGDSQKIIYKNRTRVPVTANKLAVCIHEWGGYEGARTKNIKNIRSNIFCGVTKSQKAVLTF